MHPPFVLSFRLWIETGGESVRVIDRADALAVAKVIVLVLTDGTEAKDWQSRSAIFKDRKILRMIEFRAASLTGSIAIASGDRPI